MSSEGSCVSPGPTKNPDLCREYTSPRASSSTIACSAVAHASDAMRFRMDGNLSSGRYTPPVIAFASRSESFLYR
jgi:hypothetical protein